MRGALLALMLACALGALGALGARAMAAGADPLGNCTTTSGTIVAVDFSHWGGPVARGCGVGQPTGYALLHAAGFSTTGDAHDGPGFMCRIGNRAFAGGTQYPTPAADACVRTPPATAYWSYWRAPAGQSSWSYSASGALSDDPQPGAVELWTFGGTNLGGTSGSGVPRFSPDSIRAHNVAALDVPPTTGSPAPTIAPAPPAVVTAPTAGSGPAGTRPSTPSTGRANGGRVASSTTTVERTVPTTAPVARRSGATGSTTVPRVVDALPASGSTSSGSIVPVLIGVALVLALGGGTAATMGRRRRARA